MKQKEQTHHKTENLTKTVPTGFVTEATFTPSPNYGPRPENTKINMVVVHNISLPPKEFGGPYIDDLFMNRLDLTRHPTFASLKGLKVSCHCLIRRNGKLTQYVPFSERAWHAGISSFKGEENCNDFSIGIELEGADEIPYTSKQYLSLVRLIRALMLTYKDISYGRIVGHSTIAPDRKTDPGPAFDWDLLMALLKNRKTETLKSKTRATVKNRKTKATRNKDTKKVDIKKAKSRNRK